MSLRQRIPFRFSGDDNTDDADDTRILDEQEQEEVIAHLRAQSHASAQRDARLVQAVLALSCLLCVSPFCSESPPTHPTRTLRLRLQMRSHIMFLLDQTHTAPLYVLLTAHTPPVTSIPLAAPLTLLHVLLHVLLFLRLLPPTHPLTSHLPFSLPPPIYIALPFSSPLPGSISVPSELVLALPAPLLALALVCAWPDVAWWIEPLALALLARSASISAGYAEAEITQLERLRYDARGA